MSYSTFIQIHIDSTNFHDFLSSTNCLTFSDKKFAQVIFMRAINKLKDLRQRIYSRMQTRVDSSVTCGCKTQKKNIVVARLVALH